MRNGEDSCSIDGTGYIMTTEGHPFKWPRNWSRREVPVQFMIRISLISVANWRKLFRSSLKNEPRQLGSFLSYRQRCHSVKKWRDRSSHYCQFRRYLDCSPMVFSSINFPLIWLLLSILSILLIILLSPGIMMMCIYVRCWDKPKLI